MLGAAVAAFRWHETIFRYYVLFLSSLFVVPALDRQAGEGKNEWKL